MMSDLDLDGIRRRLAQERARLAAEAAQLAGERADLLRRGSITGSRSLQMALARRLREVEARLAALAGRHARLEQQGRVLARLTRAATEAESNLLVRHVPDGDGLKLADRRRVRYLGIDAPEVSTRAGPPEPWAVEAHELNRRLVEGKRVRLERDVTEQDSHGRLLRYVYVGNVFVNAELVCAGLAKVVLTWPDRKHADLLLRLQADARRARRGLWSDQ